MGLAQPRVAKRKDTDLSNWRISPHSQWAFQNVRALIPTVAIQAGSTTKSISDAQSDELGSIPVAENSSETLAAYISESEADSMLVLNQGKQVWQWNAAHADVSQPHIVFSISKSITAMLTGILVERNLIDVTRPVSHYLPGTRGSAYEHCTVQHVLDMTVALGFNEDYLNPEGDFFAYRNATGWNPVDQKSDAPNLESFLYSLKKADFEHGEMFNYKSPNTDLLGILLERVAGVPFADLMSSLLWQPMGAKSDGYITVDQAVSPRSAGGICVTTEDLARFGQLLLNNGALSDKTIVPERWINDSFTAGDQQAWQKGNFASLLPAGRYRNKWYQVGNKDRCVTAIGIHGQWLYLNPATQTVIALLSSQADPVNDELDAEWLTIFASISSALQ